MSPRTTPRLQGESPFLRGSPPAAGRSRRPLLLIAIAAGLVIGLSSMLGENGLPSFLSLRGERTRLEQDVEALRERETRLENDLEALDEDPEALESLVREKFRMRRPGETVIEVVGEDLLDDSDAPDADRP